MARCASALTGGLFESDAPSPVGITNAPVHKADNIKWEYRWRFIIISLILHPGALYGAYLFCVAAKWQTDVFAWLLHMASILAITAGAHRLWAHRSYKAKWPLRLIFAIFHAVALQFSLITWVRMHRTHHKYSDTDGDRHNASRGFFFSHMGWLLVNDHPEYLRKSKEMDMSDVYDDPIACHQDKYYAIWAALAGFILPILTPVYCWDESWTNAVFVAMFLRFAVTFHVTTMINSLAHLWGNKPYDKTIRPTESWIYSLLTFGEGYHNYHHTFPWDYKTAELCKAFNLTKNFIDLAAKIGWAYDLKTVSEEIIEKRASRTGDGSRHLWGWGDSDQTKEERDATIRINPKHTNSD